ncbi:MAG TPA: DUF3775 domain-containing protein [Oculatellaceae cyanobacterium]
MKNPNSKRKKQDIFSVATKLNKELVEEVIRLSDLHHKTSGALFKTQVPVRKRKSFYSAADWVRAQDSAPNLPKIGLEDFIATLSHEQRIELMDLAWLGRNDGPPGTVRQSLESLVKHARKLYNPGGYASYLIHKPLGRYLKIASGLSPTDIVLDEVEIEMRLGL